MKNCPKCDAKLLKKRIKKDGHIWFSFICPNGDFTREVKPDPNEAWREEE